MPAITGTTLAAKISPGDTAATFATHEDIYGQGGLRTVASYQELLSIPLDRQKVGMIIYVSNTNIYYRIQSLSSPLTTATTQFSLSGLSLAKNLIVGTDNNYSLNSLAVKGTLSAVGVGTHTLEASSTQAAVVVKQTNYKNYDVGGNILEVIGGYYNTPINVFTVTNKHSIQEGYNTIASANYSHAEGHSTTASGDYSHAEGWSNTTSSNAQASHAEGRGNIASADYSHVEGYSNVASSIASHSQGRANVAAGGYSHVEGTFVATGEKVPFASYSAGTGVFTFTPTTSAKFSYVVPGTTKIAGAANLLALGPVSFEFTVSARSSITGSITATVPPLPSITITSPSYLVSTAQAGSYAHAEGYGTTAYGQASHAEGRETQAIGGYSHAEGWLTISSSTATHTEGVQTSAVSIASHAEGGQTRSTGYASHAEGSVTTASGTASHAEGSITTASGTYSHAEGSVTTASGDSSHAEGSNTQAIGGYSHAEGSNTTASGLGSHAEGYRTRASGTYSHAEGSNTTASGDPSHAEGSNTQAIGGYSHAEGHSTTAFGSYSHAAGFRATAAQNHTYAWSDGNLGTLTSNVSTTRTGQYMVSASGGVFIPGNVGIGTDYNSATLTVNGTLSAIGKITAGSITANSSNIPLSIISISTDKVFSDADTNKVFHFNTSAIALSAMFPSTLSQGFNVAIMNTGTNTLNLSTGSNLTYKALGNKIRDQYAGSYVYKSDSDIFAVGGL